MIFCHVQSAELQEQLRDGPLRSLLSKIEALAARLALTFEIASNEHADEVRESTMKTAVEVAEWLRYEAARIYQKYDFEEQSKSRDERLAASLPDTFGWEYVADTWGVGKRGAYKVIKRLSQKGLAEDAGHGKYRCLAEFIGHSGHFIHFAEVID